MPGVAEVADSIRPNFVSVCRRRGQERVICRARVVEAVYGGLAKAGWGNGPTHNALSEKSISLSGLPTFV